MLPDFFTSAQPQEPVVPDMLVACSAEASSSSAYAPRAVVGKAGADVKHKYDKSAEAKLMEDELYLQEMQEAEEMDDDSVPQEAPARPERQDEWDMTKALSRSSSKIVQTLSELMLDSDNIVSYVEANLLSDGDQVDAEDGYSANLKALATTVKDLSKATPVEQTKIKAPWIGGVGADVVGSC